MAHDDGEGFFARWSRRKGQARPGTATPQARPPAPPAAEHREPPAPVQPAPVQVVPADEAPAAPAPTLADVAALTRDSDYTRFVAAGVDESVKRAALRKLVFSDPHFNVMDGLDIYIDDYHSPDPLPASVLREMWQARSLGLVDDEPPGDSAQASPDGAAPASVPESDPAAAAAPRPTEPFELSDEDPDLQLQPDDDAGRSGDREGAGPGRG